MIKNFIEEAKGFIRNPLGIIALFISLIYGFACLVLNKNISNLEGKIERLPLIWFIILFPLVVLIAFIFLVIKHHEKLYSPMDYRTDDSFMQATLSSAQVARKQLNDVKQLESSPAIANKDEPIIGEITEKLHSTEDAVSKDDVVKESTENDLLIIYENSQKWVIDELCLRYKVIFNRNVALKIGQGQFEFDAFATDINGVNYIIEVKYWQTLKSDKKLKLVLQDFISKTKDLKQNYPNSRIIIVLVYDNLKIVDKNDMKNFVKSLNMNISVLFFDYHELKKNYE